MQLSVLEINLWAGMMLWENEQHNKTMNANKAKRR